MKIILLILFLIICPMLLGGGFVQVMGMLSKKVPSGRRLALFDFYNAADSFSLGVLILLLIAGISNGISYFLSLNVAYASRLFSVLLILVLTVCYFLTVIGSLAKFKAATDRKPEEDEDSDDKADDTGGVTSDIGVGKKRKTPVNTSSLVLTILCVLLSLVPVAVIIFSTPDFYGDQTLETVRSFQYTGEIYSVNPLTGLSYEVNGLPSRVPFMCMPFFYTVLCNTFGCDAALLIRRIMPIFWLITGYTCFIRIGNTIFEDSKKRFIFYAVSVLLLISATAAPTVIGFDALFSGFRGISIVCLILTTWTVGTALKKKWPALILPVIIEPLITSTLFGLGACIVIGIGMLIVSIIMTKGRRAA